MIFSRRGDGSEQGSGLHKTPEVNNSTWLSPGTITCPGPHSQEYKELIQL